MLSVDRKALLAALETLKTVADPKSNIPALANVTMTAEGGAVRLSATDLYRSAWVTLPGEGSGAWSRSADLRTVLDRAKRFRNGHCDLTADGATVLCLTEGARHFAIRGIDPTDTPPLPTEEKSEGLFTLDDATLTQAIDRVIYAASSDETRSHLNAVLFEITRNNLRLVATDGHRLALWDTPVDGTSRTWGAKEAVGILLSLDGVQALRAMVAPKKGRAPSPVVVTMAGSHVFAKVRGVTLALRKVEAQFPPYVQVIPATSTRTVTCDRALLAEVVAAIGACAPDRTGMVKLGLSNDRLTVSTEDPDAGTATETMPVTRSGQAGDFKIGVNATFLTDALAKIADETVSLGFQDPLAPIVMRPKEGGIVVVMPMRIT